MVAADGAHGASTTVIDELRRSARPPTSPVVTRAGAGRGVRGPLDEEADSAAKRILVDGIEQLSDAQELLWASDTYVADRLQAMGAAAMTIEHVMSGVNPQGVQVVSFKQPTEARPLVSVEDLQNTPERGRIGIFNRSHYEEVVTLRVHPDWLALQHLPSSDRGPAFWAGRYDDVNAFERHLDRNGIKVVKFFLHVSKAEQKRRFMARLDHPEKNWKFSAADVAERAHWDEYMQAYDDAITATSTEWAPWYVVPADNKHVMQAMAVSVIVETIHTLDLHWPIVSDAARQANAEARAMLEAEAD